MSTATNTILIVEDDPYDSQLIVRAMKKARIINPVQTVGNGEEAVSYLQGASPYDNREQHPLPTLILLDLKMPLMDGFEFLAWLRSHTKLRNLPVVVLTSSNQTPDIERAYELGANSYLVKPVKSDALVDMLKNVELYWLVTNTNPTVEDP